MNESILGDTTANHLRFVNVSSSNQNCGEAIPIGLSGGEDDKR